MALGGAPVRVVIAVAMEEGGVLVVVLLGGGSCWEGRRVRRGHLDLGGMEAARFGVRKMSGGGEKQQRRS
ncbi:hypothetical protein E2562_026255 [Oryza meyeriana var. granulata]|uniref:DUF834 domain-containing protein n=1 Tax=Oryza meyeriana var. granulata TaxID=110450 RepID=A0A6G1CJS2_9ORYZ|nr:hypothetical protein E2562_026255 [Oryza meyeriana var. granulata]